MRVALDTNILAYAEGVGDRVRCQTARKLLEDIPEGSVLILAQTLGELYRVLTGKVRWKPLAARRAVLGWSDCFQVADSTWTALQSALDLSVAHMLNIWDALIVSVAAENRCRLLLSEDLQNTFTWHGLTVVNPFDSVKNPLLVSLIDDAAGES